MSHSSNPNYIMCGIRDIKFLVTLSYYYYGVIDFISSKIGQNLHCTLTISVKFVADRYRVSGDGTKHWKPRN